MRFSSISPHQALILFPLVLSSLATAFSLNQKRQGASDDSCGGDDEAPTLDGPTSDKSAGLGIEFESSQVTFEADCDDEKTNQAKGRQVGDRKGTNWALTADTTEGRAGSLTAEYILNGKVIKIGDGTASAAAAAVSNDLIAWKPYKDMPQNTWDIDENECNPWHVSGPSAFNPDYLSWQVQATAPLPFEAISDLFAESIVTSPSSPLLPATANIAKRNKISVTSKFFQSSPNGITSGSVKQDLLGFFSLVVSYAKAASSTDPPIYQEESPKSRLSIMPRTDFVTLYAQVSGALPGSDTLYNLVKVLACYKNDDDDVEIDSQFCDGTVQAPKPNKYMDGIGWCLKDSIKNNQDCLLVSDWIASIQSGPSPDKLTTLDKLIDSSIGGLGTGVENVVGTTRGVPIFEFRNLNGVAASKFESTTTNVESELQKYHKKYQSPPTKRRKARRSMRNGKRQAPSSCPTITSASSMPTCSLQEEDPDQGINTQGCICGSSTLPLLTVASATNQDQSCSYTAFPTSSVTNPISIMSTTYTSNCQACTQTGGIADSPTCTTVSGCTPTTAILPVTSTAAPPPPSPSPPPPPVCKAGFYGTDTSCGGTCNGPTSNCQCIEAGYEAPNNSCTCKC